jgi:hypothetical protein
METGTRDMKAIQNEEPDSDAPEPQTAAERISALGHSFVGAIGDVLLDEHSQARRGSRQRAIKPASGLGWPKIWWLWHKRPGTP